MGLGARRVVGVGEGVVGKGRNATVCGCPRSIPVARRGKEKSLMEKMTVAQVEAQLKKAKEWSLAGEAIQRTYLFPDFMTAMKFVDQVATTAEAAAHHPDILIRYSKVTLTLATHDANGITAKDFDLASKCDELAKKLVKKPAKA